MGMLEQKAIAITGAARGLGRGHALHASRAGARVVVNDIDEDGARAVIDEIRSAGGEAELHVGSVSDYPTAAALVQTCRDAFGAIDGLVNNAGVYYRAAPSEETEAQLRRIVEVNVLGSMFCAIHAFEAMREQGHGTIVNTISGAHVGIPGMTAYGATKGAVGSLTYNLAIEGQPHGIRVNALSPIADTAMGAGEPPRADGRIRPKPEAISPAMVFLLSDHAAEVTGQVLRFDSWSLSFMELPNFRTKRVETVDWTAEEIARLYASELTSERRPVGLASNITFELTVG